MNLGHSKKRFALVRLTTLFAAFLAVLACSPAAPSDGRNWYQVRKGDLIVDLVESGEIRAIRSRFVQAPYEWRADLQIIDMVPEGVTVKKGDFLVQFDTGFLEAELGQAQSNLETNQAELKRLKAEQDARMKQLMSDLTSARYAKKLAELQLEKLKFESESKRSEARLALQKAEVALKEAKTKIRSQRILDSLATEKVLLSISKERAKVNEVRGKMEELTLRAPISGLVVYSEYYTTSGYKKYQVGDKVSPGRAIIGIPDLSRMEVVFPVHELDREKIKPGQKVNVTLEAFPERTFHAEIRDIARLAERASRESQVKVFQVRAALSENDPILKPGMTARVQVILRELKDVLLVPCTAVYENEGQPVVFTEKNWPKATPVKLGPRNHLYFAAESGLKPGDRIAYHPPPAVQHRYHKLGYSEAQQRDSHANEILTRHLQRMQLQGLAFDYAAHRNKKNGAKGADSTRTSAAPELDRSRGTITLPGGRSVSLPPEILKKLKATGPGQVKIQVFKGAGDSSGVKRKTVPSKPDSLVATKKN